MKRVVAIDPGKTTGLAWWEEGWWTPVLEQLSVFEAVERVHAGLHRGLLTCVVCEDFIITPNTAKKSRETHALDGLGATRYLTHLYDVPLQIYRSSEAKTFATDALLRRIGWYQKGQPHARDASRHLVLFLTRSAWIPPAEILRARDETSGALEAVHDVGAGADRDGPRTPLPGGP